MKNKLANVFTNIYETNGWKNKESRSGPGSTLAYTENLRKELPILFKKYNIENVLDAPCGDFNWFKDIVATQNINYTGGDIVSSLIDKNNSMYKSDNINFELLDITKDPLPDADLMVCRDCLFHLSNEDIKKFFVNFINSNINYLLTTTHVNLDEFKNYDIESGKFRKIDLFSDPFSLPKDVLYSIDDWIEGFPPRKMVLFSKNQISKSLS